MAEQKIGVDEWVAQHQARITKSTDLRAVVYRAGERLPLWGRLALLIIVGLSIPMFTGNTYFIRIALNVALMAMLGLALNIVVGYAGLLDLGFVAFYGIGAYTYAYLSSDFIGANGVHWPTVVSLPFTMLLTALFGLLVGATSLRLVGDYLAIVTLGFGQVFVQLMTSLTRVKLPGLENPVDLTGGPNGIVNLDSLSTPEITLGPISIPAITASTITHYYYISLSAMVIVLLIIYHMNKSRLGRAWRAMREDELAAEAMGMPTRRLKLMAFTIGAALAGLTGALFAAQQGSIFPSNFDVGRLITLYAIVVLGGLGSLPGVIIGAIIMMVMPEILRAVDIAGIIFYVGILVGVVALIKPRWKAAALLAVVVVFGFIAKAGVGVIAPEWLAELPMTRSIIGDAIRSWLAIPVKATLPGNLAFAVLVGLVLLVVWLKNESWRFVALVPTLYLLAFVWETRLSQEPSVTRLLFVGVLLIVLMIYRPNGLLGQRRIEIG